jgi:transposase-like protein
LPCRPACSSRISRSRPSHSRPFVHPTAPGLTAAPTASCTPGTDFRYHRHGVFHRAADRRSVPRFRCLACRRTFSLQTFAFSYYLKRASCAVPIAAGLLAGSAHRQLGRSLACAASTVTRLSARLGRHALLFSAQAFEQLPALDEPVVYDDFESFVYCQDLPVGFGTAVGHRSWYVYDLEQAPHRRGGRLSPSQRQRQKQRLERAGRPIPGAYERAFSRTLRLLLSRLARGQRLRLFTDGHAAYARVLKHASLRPRVEHRAYSNPPRGPKGAPRRREARQRDAALFPVDLLHGLLRHSLAHHRRETIAFGRRLNALMERGFLTLVWRNFVKARSERRPEAVTPAMYVGLTSRPWTWRQVLGRRRFVTRQRVPREWLRVYRRELVTRIIGRNCRHELVNAY